MLDNLLTSFRDRLSRGSDPTLATDLESAVRARRDARAGHTDWGLLCEEAGLFSLAFSEFQLALRDNPNDPVAGFRLAQHYRERGDLGRSADLLERLLQSEPAREEWLLLLVEVLREDGAQPRLRAALDRAVQAGFPGERARALQRPPIVPPDEPESEPSEPALTPGDADCVRFQHLFAGREGVHARQWAKAGGESGYSPIHEPLTPAVVRNHLLGTYTVGVYPIRLDGTCTFFALDLDIDKSALEQAHSRPAMARTLRDALRNEARRLLSLLRELGCAPLFEDSGYKGRHFWVFLEQPEPASVLHLFGRQLLAWQTRELAPGLHLEFFPKQGSAGGKGLGNLIKLPLGIHRRTGRRALFLDDTGQPVAAPFAALRQVRRLPQTALYAAIERVKSLPPPPPISVASTTAEVPGASTREPRRAGPPVPPPAPAWTEADFEADPRVRHLLAHCPVLAELKRQVDQHRQLSHEEQLVLIHSLGHLEGGPQAVNYLLSQCVDVGPEKFMKDRLKGNPVSCASIRKKIGHITRRVPCNCPFDFAPDRYPTPVLHLLTLPSQTVPAAAPAAADVSTLAGRFAALAAKRAEIERDYQQLRQALVTALRTLPERTASCTGGRFRLVEQEGVEELLWEPGPASGATDQPGPHPESTPCTR